jgi:peptidylprolyl isomerase
MAHTATARQIWRVVMKPQACAPCSHSLAIIHALPDPPAAAMAPPPIMSSLSPLTASTPTPSPAPLPKPTSRALAAIAACNASSSSVPPCHGRRGLLALGAGFLASAALLGQAGDAEATRIEYYATVGDKMCDMSLVKSGLAYCDVEVGTGAQPPRGELINVSTERKRFRVCYLVRVRTLISFPLQY